LCLYAGRIVNGDIDRINQHIDQISGLLEFPAGIEINPDNGIHIQCKKRGNGHVLHETAIYQRPVVDFHGDEDPRQACARHYSRGHIS